MNSLKIPAQTIVLLAGLNLAQAFAQSSGAPLSVQRVLALLEPWRFTIFVLMFLLCAHRKRLFSLAWLGFIVLWTWGTASHDFVALLMPVAAAIGLAALVNAERPHTPSQPSVEREIEHVDEPPERAHQPLPGGRPDRIIYLAPPRTPRGAPHRDPRPGWYDQHD